MEYQLDTIDPIAHSYRTHIDIVVRWGDVDAMGHVNNCRIYQYFEEARVQYFNAIGAGVGLERLKEFPFVLAHGSIDYVQTLQMGDRCRAYISVYEMGNASVKHVYRLESVETGEVVATGRTVLVAYDYSRECTQPIPKPLRAAIEKFEEK